jgi:integrase
MVCRYKGQADRFFGKYKDPSIADARKSWRKIPGGAFPTEANTPEKALAHAARWFEGEMADRATRAAQPPDKSIDWAQLCDLFLADVAKRVRGADATRDELKKRARFLRSSEMLAGRPLARHDEELAVAWVRHLLSEPLPGKGEPRDPLTVRNVARVLGEIYRFARARGHLPAGRTLPTDGDEFRAEIAGALKEKAKLGKLTRVACPTETVAAIVACAEVPELRRVTTQTYYFTGMRPGELHGLRVADYRAEHGVNFLDLREQQTLPRKDYPSRLAPLKTVWARRKVPVHPSLAPALDAWVREGWARYVGREPKQEDFLFPDPSGAPFRELSCEEFLADVERAGCSTLKDGVRLELYSLRHAFATAARRAGIPSDARDRLLGHRPRDTKALHYEDEDLPLLAKEVAKIPAVTKALNGSENRQQGDRLVPGLVTAPITRDAPPTDSSTISAEEKGFEPLDDLRRRRFSKTRTRSRRSDVCAAAIGELRRTKPLPGRLPKRLPRSSESLGHG